MRADAGAVTMDMEGKKILTVDDHLWFQILLQVILILLNAFFASAEIAVLSVNENKMRRRAETGDKKAARILNMIEEPAGFLSTIQVGITLAGFLGSAFAAENFAGRLSGWLARVTGASASVMHTISVIAVTLVLSYFTLVLGELVPKRIAMKKAETVAGFASGVISGLSKVMRPIIWFLSKSTNAILRLFGISPKEEAEQITEEDLLMMVDMSQEAGNIDSDESRLIHNIFQFDNTTAEDVMTHRTQVTALPLDAAEETILQTVAESGYSRIPVYEDRIDNIVGVLSAKSYLINRNCDGHQSLRELMSACYFVPESISADQLLREMQRRKQHIAVVVDNYGGTSGIVTLEDLLEEIVGEIYDESDEIPEKERREP